MVAYRKTADFRRFFGDAEYVAERLASIQGRGRPTAGGCIEWTGEVSSFGYGRVSFGNAKWQVHRLLWLIHRGEVGNLVVDHLCRNKRCINLDHLEPVTNQANVQRGHDHRNGPGLCSKGLHRLQRVGRANSRQCRECKADDFRLKYRADPEFRERMKAKRRRNHAKAKLS